MVDFDAIINAMRCVLQIENLYSLQHLVVVVCVSGCVYAENDITIFFKKISGGSIISKKNRIYNLLHLFLSECLIIETNRYGKRKLTVINLIMNIELNQVF